MQLPTLLLAVVASLATYAAADVRKLPAHLGDGYSPKRLRQPKDKFQCEDKRKSAVQVCEVYPRSGECTGLRADWRSCISNDWGYDLKSN